MAVELSGTVTIRGDSGPAKPVRVLAEHRHLRLTSEDRVVGDWDIGEIGIHVLQVGFVIRAEGEEFVLHTEDDAAVADELRIATASPRIARQVAARHKPDRPLPEPEPVEEETVDTDLAGIAYAVAGLLVVLGGIFLRMASSRDPTSFAAGERASGGSELWLVFIVGGVLMVAAAYVMSIGVRWARLLAWLLLVGTGVGFGLVASRAIADSSHLTAYGFVAGGIVVAVAVLFSGALSD